LSVGELSARKRSSQRSAARSYFGKPRSELGFLVRLRVHVRVELHEIVVRVIEEVGVGCVAAMMRPEHLGAVAADVLGCILQWPIGTCPLRTSSASVIAL
jgi:hypothetical protein